MILKIRQRKDARDDSNSNDDERDGEEFANKYATIVEEEDFMQVEKFS